MRSICGLNAPHNFLEFAAVHESGNGAKQTLVRRPPRAHLYVDGINGEKAYRKNK